MPSGRNGRDSSGPRSTPSRSAAPFRERRRLLAPAAPPRARAPPPSTSRGAPCATRLPRSTTSRHCSRARASGPSSSARSCTSSSGGSRGRFGAAFEGPGERARGGRLRPRGLRAPRARGARPRAARRARARGDAASASPSDFDARGRLALEQVVMRVSVDLDAAVELLDLERARASAPGAMTGAHARAARSDVATSDRAAPAGPDAGRSAYGSCTGAGAPASGARADLPRPDPHVFKRLVALRDRVARPRRRPPAEVSVRARSRRATRVAHRGGAAIERRPSARAAPTTLRLVQAHRARPTRSSGLAAAERGDRGDDRGDASRRRSAGPGGGSASASVG